MIDEVFKLQKESKMFTDIKSALFLKSRQIDMEKLTLLKSRFDIEIDEDSLGVILKTKFFFHDGEDAYDPSLEFEDLVQYLSFQESDIYAEALVLCDHTDTNMVDFMSKAMSEYIETTKKSISLTETQAVPRKKFDLELY